MKLIMLSLMSLSLFSCSKKDDLSCVDTNRADPNMACIEIYAPVCGCNGETYGNECYAESAGVLSWTEGKCN